MKVVALKLIVFYKVKITMQVNLNHIVVFNFKSFKGEVIIGPIKPFTAIIGANGSGKSNIMDAISFVMGESAKNLRVKKFNELIYGAYGEIPMAHRAYVTAVFTLEDNSIKSFTRSIYHTSCEYKINDQVVVVQLYLSELRKLNLNVKAKNFLIFQGAIDSTILKTPKEYTNLFEEISNSIELKEEYERLKNEISNAENEIRFIYKRKKDLLIKKKYDLLQKEETEKYQELYNQYLKNKTELYLFELFHIQKDIQDLEITLNITKSKIIEYERNKSIESGFLKERKEQLEIANKVIENIEQNLINVKNNVRKKETNLIESKEKVLYWEQKLNSTNLLLLETQKYRESHIKTIKELKNELTQIEHAKYLFEENITTQLLSQDSIELNDIQINEYFRLKQISETKCSKHVETCNSFKCEQNINQNKLDNENRKKYDLETKLNQKIILKDETEKCIKKIQQCMKEIQDMLTDKINIKNNLENIITQQKKDVETIQLELQYICEQLDCAKIDKFTILHLNKEAETIKILQNLFSGVYGRLYNLCKPIHSRYHIAMTKVLGKYCNSIIVSTNKVAIQCINYLKEQQIGSETFLPVENLKVEPIKEILRGITEPKNVKLLYDVLKFELAEINNAILFVTKNTIVCETPEDARMLAYEINPYHRINCVALDGTYYKKDGIISGGEVELLKKAQIWNEQNLIQLKSKKVILMEQLREKIKISQSESEINTLNIQIKSFTSRINYSTSDLNNHKNKIITLQHEIEVIQNELDIINNNIASIKDIMMEKNQKIQNIEKSIMNIEDMIFKDFCNNIGISNIRQYEQGNLKFHQEQTKRKLELEEQYNRIQNLLDFEINRDTENAILKMTKNVKIVKNELEKAHQSAILCTENNKYELNKLNNLQNIYDEAKNNINKETENVNKYRCNISIISKLIISTQKEITIIKTNIKKKKAKCYAILINCKVENIIIPFLSGNIANNLEDIEISDSLNSEEMHDIEILSRIDFDILSEDIKNRTEENINNSKNKLVKEIEKLQNKIESIKNPNFKANKEIEHTIEKLKETNFKYQELRKKINLIKKQFELVKQERYNRFAHCFEYITTKLNSIYKCLMEDESVQAILLPENLEEPYLSGINYSCIMPGKRFQSFSNLSGGEKTLATIAFLFAIHSFRPAPFFILDEIDAALDTINIKNVVRLIHSKKNEMQFIIISLKREIYSCADVLIGVCSDTTGEYPESLVFTLSLEKYLISHEE